MTLSLDEFRPALEALRTEGISGSEAVKRLTARGIADNDARRLIAAFLIENRAARQQAEESIQHSSTEEIRTVSSLPETVTIKTSEYLDLVKSDLKLRELEAAGVDSWDGYDEIDRGAIRSGVEEAKAALIVAADDINGD